MCAHSPGPLPGNGSCLSPACFTSTRKIIRSLMNLHKFVSLVSLLLLASTLTFAQGSASGDLHVAVKDQKGSAVANAIVTVQEQGKATQRSTSNNATGEY